MSVPRTVWWLGYWRAGERIYWWTTCISPDVTRDELRERVQALVTPATWETCVDPARTTARPGEVDAAFVAAGAADWADVAPHLATLEAGVPVQTDPDLAARQESLERRRKRAADLTSLLGTLPPEARADQSTDLLVETIIHGVPDDWHGTDHRRRTDVLAGRRWSTPEDGDRSGCTRAELSELLRSRPWGRFVFHGHVTSGDRHSPTAAAIVLQPPTGPGETPMTTSDGRALEAADHTGDISARVWLHEPTRWPMPRRVAFIACQSDDAGYVEQTGLTLAAANAGARVVVTTRWTLPTDSTSRTTDSVPLGPGPTTAIALAVDEALCAPDPVRALRSRQLAELRRWREASTPEQRRRHAPLLWSALVTYVLPASSASTSLDPDPTSP